MGYKRSFRVLKEETKYQNPWLKVTELVTEKDGKKGIYGVVHRSNSSTIIVETEKNRILMVKQFRYPTQNLAWELPMGGVDNLELPLETATRELKEEAGLEVRLTKLGEFHPIPGLTPQKAYVFHGCIKEEEVESVERNSEAVDEIVERKFFTRQEISKMIKNNEISDGFTLCSLAILRWNEK